MDLETRVRRLERRTRALSALLGLAVAVLVAGAAGSVPKELRARAFVLEGPGGKVVARWTAEPDAGKAKVPAADLRFYDAEARVRASIGCAADGYAFLGVYGPDGRSSAGYVVSPDGGPRIEIDDERGHATFSRP